MGQRYIYLSAQDVLELAEIFLSNAHVEQLRPIMYTSAGNSSRLLHRGQQFLEQYAQSSNDVEQYQQAYEQAIQDFNNLFEQIQAAYEQHIHQLQPYLDSTQLGDLRLLSYQPSTERTILLQAQHVYKRLQDQAYASVCRNIEILDSDIATCLAKIEQASAIKEQLNIRRRHWRKADTTQKEMFDHIRNWNAHVLMKARLRSKTREEVLQLFRVSQAQPVELE